MEWPIVRVSWTASKCKDGLREVARMDEFFDRVEAYRYAPGREVVGCDFPFLRELSEVYSESYWTSIISMFKIKCDSRLYKSCLAWSKSNPVNPGSVFLGTWAIDEKASYHEALMGRTKECMTYGLFKPFHWLAFFASLGMRDCIEIRSIAHLVKMSKGMPFKVSKGDNSRLDEVALFYNMPNLIETQLNIANLRASLTKKMLELTTSVFDGEEHKYEKRKICLDGLLDELSLSYGVMPKGVCKEIRSFLTLAIRAGGMFAHKQRTFKHERLDEASHDRADQLQSIDFDGDKIFKPFRETKAMKKSLEERNNTLIKLKLFKLQRAINVYLYTSLRETAKNDFIMFGSFLHSIMALAGYGRALSYSSAPVQGNELLEDKHGVAGAIESLMLSFHNQAQAAGFTPPVESKWIPACIGYWKSTSAGVKPMEVSISIDGVPTKIKFRKKAAIGAIMGKNAFMRKTMSIKNSKDNPGSVGNRDVPYKPSRSIYVVSLPTQCAQIAVTSHLVNFISTRGNKRGLFDGEFDPSHCSTGPYSSTGQRIVDNYDTIASSGDPQILAIGTDLSSYDASLVWWNFRKPMLSALRKMGMGNTFGPERITNEEIVDFAYGKGYIYDSFWDNGREPLVVFIDKVDEVLISEFAPYVKRIVVGESSGKLRAQSGMKFLKKGEYHTLDVKECIAEGKEIPWKYLRVAVRGDGADLIRLTSEASGELSTLAMNTIANLAMQRIALNMLKDTDFGKAFKVRYVKGVGDDAEWIGNLLATPTAEVIDEMLENLENVYKEMGHTFSACKTFVIPLSSEYVQTFARLGLYIPRDQIMVIASEKPRSVRNPHGFLSSFKQLLLSKCSRGFSPDYALALLLLYGRELSKLYLNRHVPTDSNPDAKFIRVANLTKKFVRVRDFKFVRKSTLYINKEIPRRVFVFSSALLMLPVTVGGCGMCPLLPLVNLTPAVFLYFISLYDKRFQESMYSFLVFMGNKPLNNGEFTKDDTRIGRVVIPPEMKTLGVNDIFSPTVQRNIMILKDVEIGRSAAERVPIRLLRQGLEMEGFMENEANYEREVYAEQFLSKITRPMAKMAHDGDEWVLTFKFTQRIISLDEMHGSSFYGGLAEDYNTLLKIYGMSWHSVKMNKSMERLRLTISRDPALRGIVSPEEVYALLDRFGISSASDRVVGNFILLRMGFEPSVADAILDIRVTEIDDVGVDCTYGSFSDDFGSSLNLYTRDRLNTFEFPPSLNSAAKRIMLLYASNISVLCTLFHGKPTLVCGASPRGESDDITPLRKLISMPRTHRKIILGIRDRARLVPTILSDLMELLNATSNKF